MEDFYREQDEIRKAAPERKAAQEAQAARLHETWVAEEDAKGISDWKRCVSQAAVEGIDIKSMPPCVTTAAGLSAAARKMIGHGFDVRFVCSPYDRRVTGRCYIAVVGGKPPPPI